MKINTIEIANFIGITRAYLELTEPVLVVAGDNAQGKSSIADAISMALVGKPRRVNAKKDLGQLLHDDAEKGRVSVLLDDSGEGGEYRIPKGDHHISEFPGLEFVPYLVDPQLFASISDDDRRTMLFKLTNCKASAKLVGESLAKRGVSEEVIAEILPMMRGGFPAASREAYARATQAKGAWRSITGQNWGSVAAEGWKAPEPEGKVPTASEMDALLAKVTKHQADLEEGIKFVAQQDALLTASLSRSNRIAKESEIAEQLGRRQAKLKTDLADMEAWEEKVPALQSKLDELKGARTPIKCPCCDEELSFIDGALVKFSGRVEGNKERADVALALTNATSARDLLRSTVANDHKAIAESKAAADMVKSIEAEKGVAVDVAKLEKSRESITKLRTAIAEGRAEFNAKQEVRNASAGVAKKTSDAAKAHEEVKQWLAAGDALAPDGIPGELLNDALVPVNQSIAVLSGMCGWAKAEVRQDMSITFGGRLYGLCSASERWRADALIALAIAQISQLKFVVLDGFDVLMPKDRPVLLRMLTKLAGLGSMESMIMCGTMKEPMKEGPGYRAVWISNGIADMKEA